MVSLVEGKRLGVKTWFHFQGGQLLCGGAGQAKTVKYAFLTGQADKHDRQPKRREKGGPNAFLPKRLGNITSSDLLTEIHHLGGTDHWHE